MSVHPGLRGSPVRSSMSSLGGGVRALIVNNLRFTVNRTVRNRCVIDALLVILIERHIVDVVGDVRQPQKISIIEQALLAAGRKRTSCSQEKRRTTFSLWVAVQQLLLR